MPLSFPKLFRRIRQERRATESIQTPILEAKAKDILESERSGIKPNTIAASHIAAKHGFGLFNFLGGAGG